MVRIIMVLVLLSTLACGGGGGGESSSGGSETPAPNPQISKIPARPAADPELAWWNRAVFYEVFVRSFADAGAGPLAGDGIGDLQGLIDRLDYLNDGNPNTRDDLGVTALWLMPIMESPSYHGYDVVDYQKVESDYGSNPLFQVLMDEAKRRDMKIILDLVLNHSSSAHPWFQQASSGNAAFNDFYVWSSSNPGFRGPWDQQVWHSSGNRYYYGLFWSGMPDLNYNNPAVTAEVHNLTRFWLQDMRVDGFRLDAIRYLFEEGQDLDDVSATHAWLKEYQTFYKSLNPQAMTVGEVWADSQIVASYAGDMDMTFQFDLAGAILQAANSANGSALSAQLNRSMASFPGGRFATFITNHDQDRVMSQLGGDPARARLAATLLLTMPGVPFVYYGEELGMKGEKPDELIRTPLQWSPAANAGFSTAEPWQAVNGDYQSVNIALQTGNPDSLLSLYRNLIHLRTENSALAEGNLTVVKTSSSNLLAWLRQSADQDVLILINIAANLLESYTVDLEAPYATSQELLQGSSLGPGSVKTVNGIAGYQPIASLAPRTGYIILLK